MRVMRMAGAFVLAAMVTFTLASAFYTQQVLADQAAIGAVYTPSQQAATYLDNFMGLMPAYGLMITIALLLGFGVAAIVKRILKPLAPIAYPIAGAAAVFTVIWLIENVVASGGVGAIGGARSAFGLTLQCFAGFIGGVVFALTRSSVRN